MPPERGFFKVRVTRIVHLEQYTIYALIILGFHANSAA